MNKSGQNFRFVDQKVKMSKKSPKSRQFDGKKLLPNGKPCHSVSWLRFGNFTELHLAQDSLTLTLKGNNLLLCIHRMIFPNKLIKITRQNRQYPNDKTIG